MLEAFKAAWVVWRRGLRHVGRLIDVVLMSVVYLLVLAPIAVGARLLGHRFLDTGPRPVGPPAPPRDSAPMSMERATRRY